MFISLFYSKKHKIKIVLLVLCQAIFSLLGFLAQAQDAPLCGVVDALRYPVDSVETRTIARGYDDFGIFRARWEGNHVGLDVAFREQGNPIYATARGRVTYSDIEGWGTEGGVVILEHVLPDNSIYYSVYGHVQETDDITLPTVGDCVELGETIAAVGWPENSAQHLHYEIRRFLPDDGGPGYVEGNPIDDGWYHPLDFTLFWQLRLNENVLDYAAFDAAPTLPPVRLENGTWAFASDDVITVLSPPDSVLWRVTLDDVVSGLATLPGNRVVAHSRSGQVATLANGRYEALWTTDTQDIPFAVYDDRLIFVRGDGGLIAFTAGGDLLWQLDPAGSPRTLSSDLQHNTNSIALTLPIETGVSWRAVDLDGNLIYDTIFADAPIVAPVNGDGWMVLSDGELQRINPDGSTQSIATVDVQPGRTAQMVVDLVGNVYLFAGDRDNTLIAWDVQGNERWRMSIPSLSTVLLPPLLELDIGCSLFSLDEDGQLTVINTQDGTVAHQLHLYAGGDSSGRPSGRILQSQPDGTLVFGAGFLTLVTLDGIALSSSFRDQCILG